MRKDIIFDVFLCHNGLDKPQVLEIAIALKQMGLRPWLDIWEMPPGMSWQSVLEQQIPSIKSVAVFVGCQGIGPWQQQELEAFLREFARRKCRVIPVLLKDAPVEPELPLFLCSMTWVDFRQNYPHPMSQLVWGITGQKPQFERRHSASAPTTSLENSQSDKNSRSNKRSQGKHQHSAKKGSAQHTGIAYSKSERSLTHLLQKTWSFSLLVVAVWTTIGYVLGDMNTRDLQTYVLMASSIGGAVSGFLFGLAWKAVTVQAQPEETFIKFPAIGLVSGMIILMIIYQSLTSYQFNKHSLLIGIIMGCIFVLAFLGCLMTRKTSL